MSGIAAPVKLVVAALCAVVVAGAVGHGAEIGSHVTSRDGERSDAVGIPLPIPPPQGGRDHRPDARTAYDPSRIVSVGGAITEILYALGMEEKIVAVDTTSLYPPRALKEKPNVGYMRALSAEGVLALSPTLVLAAEGSGPKEAINILERANVPLLTVPDTFTADGIVEKIHRVARAVGAPDRGECLADDVRDDMAALEAVRRQVGRPIKVAFVLSLANGRPMLSGRGTAADGIIRMAGGENAFADVEGYKLLADEAIVAGRPEAVLVMQRSGQALTAEAVFAQPALALTAAAAHKAFVSMDGLYLLGFGPRTARAARDLAVQLYPEIKAGELPSERQSDPVPCAP
jgi:iron complex transport system substrate-binding protein